MVVPCLLFQKSAPTNNTKTYNRGDNRVRFDPDATFNQAGNFKGGFVDLEVTGNIETSDTLSIQNTTRLENGQAIDSIGLLMELYHTMTQYMDLLM